MYTASVVMADCCLRKSLQVENVSAASCNVVPLQDHVRKESLACFQPHDDASQERLVDA
jgi:hypothetical protein